MVKHKDTPAAQDADREDLIQWRYSAGTREAVINNRGSANTWQVLLSENGVPITDWLDGFRSQEAAEVIVAKYLN